MTRKIAIIGTHGTGKSTLCDYLSFRLRRRGYSVNTTPEHASDCPFEINGKDFRAQEWIVAQQFVSELEIQHQKGGRKPKDFYIFDRSILDGYVYSLDMMKRERVDKLPGWMSQIVSDHIGTYGFLFRTTIYNGGLIVDGTRSVDPVWQNEIDKLFDHVLKKKEVKYIQLPLNVEAEKELTSKEIDKLQDFQVDFMLEEILKKCKK